MNLVLILAGGCPPSIPRPRRSDRRYSECDTRQIEALKWIETTHERHPDSFKLLIGTFFAGYREYYRHMQRGDSEAKSYTLYLKHLVRLEHYGTAPLFTELGRAGIRVDVVGEDPTVPHDAPECPAGDEPYGCSLPRAVALNQEYKNRQWIRGLMDRLRAPSRLIDTTPAMCTATICRGRVNGVEVYYDDEHLGRRFTQTLTRFFQPSFDDLL